jgi:hypothetical protein
MLGQSTNLEKERDSPVVRSAEKQNSHTAGLSSSGWVVVGGALVIKEN